MSDDDAIDLGPCCACGERRADVVNVIILPIRAPIAGKGWGCFGCGLPSDGAIAVLCTPCLERGAEIMHVCVGYASSGVRVPRAACTEPFDHDLSKHEGEL